MLVVVGFISVVEGFDKIEEFMEINYVRTNDTQFLTVAIKKAMNVGRFDKNLGNNSITDNENSTDSTLGYLLNHKMNYNPPVFALC